MAINLTRSRKAAKNSYSRSSRSYTREVSLRKPERVASGGGGGGGGSGGVSFGVGGLLRWMCGITISSALLFGLVIGLLYAYRYATTNDYFAIRSITVSGNTHFDRASVLKTAGLQEGMNSLAVNIADIELALRKTAWVANVSVKRHLPDSFSIEIEERMPAFWVLKDNNLLYADSKGNLIAPVESENFISLPSLELDNGGEVLLEKLDSFVTALKGTALPLEVGTASWLRLSAARGFELFLEKHGLAISISTDRWEDNLRRLGLVLNDLARRGEIKSAREVWAADGNVWVRRDAKK